MSINTNLSDQQQQTSIHSFIPIEKIGQGSYSSVYKVRRILDNQIYALKKVKLASMQQKLKKNALNQVRLLASLQSKNIISYKQAFFDHKLNILCIVMEWANQGDLKQKIKTYKQQNQYIPEGQIWKAILHIAQGLHKLHNKSILHRDIKSANIFISHGIYKLGDLNVSKLQNDQNKLSYTQTGTPYYSCPQIWNDQPYDQKSDIWSLGCLIYQICCWSTPFKGKNLEQLYKSISKGYYQQIPIFYSKELRKIISYCLSKNPKKRPSTQNLLSESSVLIQKCIQYGIQIQTQNQNSFLLYDLLYKKKNSSQLNLCKNKINHKSQVLKTIMLPQNLKLLKKRLPKSKYTQRTIHNSSHFQFEKSNSNSNQNQEEQYLQQQQQLQQLKQIQQEQNCFTSRSKEKKAFIDKKYSNLSFQRKKRSNKIIKSLIFKNEKNQFLQHKQRLLLNENLQNEILIQQENQKQEIEPKSLNINQLKQVIKSKYNNINKKQKKRSLLLEQAKKRYPQIKQRNLSRQQNYQINKIQAKVQLLQKQNGFSTQNIDDKNKKKSSNSVDQLSHIKIQQRIGKYHQSSIKKIFSKKENKGNLNQKISNLKQKNYYQGIISNRNLFPKQSVFQPRSHRKRNIHNLSQLSCKIMRTEQNEQILKRVEQVKNKIQQCQMYKMSSIPYISKSFKKRNQNQLPQNQENCSYKRLLKKL